jgi:hypothetical protein
LHLQAKEARPETSERVK